MDPDDPRTLSERATDDPRTLSERATGDPARTLLVEAERVAGLGSYLWEPDGRVVWSDGFREILGLAPGEPPSPDAFFARVHPEDLPRVIAAWREALASTVIPTTEYRVVRPDGTLRRLRGSGEARVVDGRHCFVGALVDITERHAMEQRLAETEKTRAVVALSAGVAHDLGNWLTVLRHQAEQLAAEDPIRVEMERALAPCEALTHELLAIARGSPAQARIDEARARVQRALPLLRRAVGPRLEVTLAAGADPAWILIDPAHLETVLLNLAVNARDATPDHGTLRLGVEVDGPEDGGSVVITATDTGVGIPKEHLSRVFDPYFTTKPADRGSGLGLASVLGTIRQHQGDVRVESTVGVGTTFTIRLPRRRGPRVLVVDDLAEVRSVVTRTLERAGIHTLEASDGEEALGLVEREGCDLVVTDYVMPRMDGKALLGALQARNGPPVLLVTGYAPDPTIETIQGITVLRKPFRPNELLDAVWKALAMDPARGQGTSTAPMSGAPPK